MDGTKCSGEYCEVKDACYRYTAESSKYMQSWFFGTPIKDGECDMFWNNKKFKCNKVGVKREAESCTMNNNCIYPKCLTIDKEEWYNEEKVNERIKIVGQNGNSGEHYDL
jgi:hypothetical protein